jgi:hypothetical protein
MGAAGFKDKHIQFEKMEPDSYQGSLIAEHTSDNCVGKSILLYLGVLLRTIFISFRNIPNIYITLNVLQENRDSY